MILLAEYLNHIKVITIAGELINNPVTGVYYDSRKVTRDSIFVAIKGFNVDGHKYIGDAIQNGAIAIVYDIPDAYPETIFKQSRVAGILIENSRIALAIISAVYYGNPANKLNLFGCTGTKGKTTTTFIIKSILEASGAKTGMLGTIANYIGSEIIESTHTTPESLDLNALFVNMLSKGCSAAVMEVSSHSLLLNRVYGVSFNVAVYTNLSSEHMELHKDMNDYAVAKKILFDSLDEASFAVFNCDDFYYKTMISGCRAKKYTYGKNENADFRISNVVYGFSGTSFTLSYLKADYKIKTSLIGEFNAYNVSAAFAAAVVSGVSIADAIEGIKNIHQVPGRFEPVADYSKTVLVDYSHSSDSLEKALTNLKKLADKENRPLYTVFGCGGNRDRTKRAVMGEIASRFSKRVFVTSDNPRDEEPLAIINEIVEGIKSDNYAVVANRELAIKSAIETTESNAIIIIAGKGHEDYQIIRGVKSHFSDKEIAKKYLDILYFNK